MDEGEKPQSLGDLLRQALEAAETFTGNSEGTVSGAGANSIDRWLAKLRQRLRLGGNTEDRGDG